MFNLLNYIKKQRRPLYFISPHLDDAVFSGGALLNQLAKLSVSFQVVNVFTAFPENNSTISAQKYLKLCQSSTPESLYKKRSDEDKLVMDKLGISPINLGYVDALWRIKSPFLYHLFPELGAVYPTYRWHISKGSPSGSDRGLISQISRDLLYLLPPNALIFSPIGVGNHVDHIIVRDICHNLSIPVIYWVDYPYSTESALPHSFIRQNKLVSTQFSENLQAKARLMMGYRSQIVSTFPQGIPNLPPENYFYSSQL